MLHMKLHISDTIIYYRMSESELMNAADGSLLDISLEEELCTSDFILPVCL